MTNRKKRAGAKSAPAPAARAEPAKTAMCKIPLDVRTKRDWIEYPDPVKVFSVEGRNAAVRLWLAKQARDAYTGNPSEGMTPVQVAQRKVQRILDNRGPLEGRAQRSAEWRALVADLAPSTVPNTAKAQEVWYAKQPADTQRAIDDEARKRTDERRERALALAAKLKIDL